MNQKDIEIIFGTIIIIIVIGITYLILQSNSKKDIELIKQQLMGTIKMKNININIFIIVSILLYLFILYTSHKPNNIDIFTTIIPIAILYTSTILTGKIFLNSTINKGEIVHSILTFSLWNISIQGGGGLPKYKFKVKYEDKGKKYFGYMISFYEKKGKKMYILVDKKNKTKVYPLFILIFKGILLSLFFFISILVAQDNILKLFQF